MKGEAGAAGAAVTLIIEFQPFLPEGQIQISQEKYSFQIFAFSFRVTPFYLPCKKTQNKHLPQPFILEYTVLFGPPLVRMTGEVEWPRIDRCMFSNIPCKHTIRLIHPMRAMIGIGNGFILPILFRWIRHVSDAFGIK